MVLALKCAFSCISVWCVFNVDLEQTLIGGLAIQLTLSFKQLKKKKYAGCPCLSVEMNLPLNQWLSVVNRAVFPAICSPAREYRNVIN